MFDLRRLAPAGLGPAVLVVSLLFSSCSAEDIDGLSEAEAAMVIPGSIEWAVGEACDSDVCTDLLTVERMRSMCWAVVDPADSSFDPSGSVDDASGRAFWSIAEVVRGPLDDYVSGVVRVDAARDAAETSEIGLELIVGYECDQGGGLEEIYIVVAVDDKGRVAGIGPGAGLHTTAPLVQGAVEAGAESAEGYLLEVLGG